MRGLVRRPSDTLRHISRLLMDKYLERVPTRHPVRQWARRCSADLTQLTTHAGDRLDRYHAWAFAGTRQLGSAFELAALDYVLKPLGRERLAATLQRVRGEVAQGAQRSGQAAALREALSSEALRREPLRRLPVRHRREVRCEARLLRGHGDVDVLHPPAERGDA